MPRARAAEASLGCAEMSGPAYLGFLGYARPAASRLLREWPLNRNPPVASAVKRLPGCESTTRPLLLFFRLGFLPSVRGRWRVLASMGSHSWI